MSVRFKNKSDIFNVVVTAVAAVLSVGIMLYGVWHFGLRNTWPELVLNLFYIACIVKLAVYPIQKACLVLSVVLLLLLTYFYARKDWKSYTKSNLWLIFIVDMVIAILYNIDIVMETADEYTAYMLVEIWIRPTITYGLVACYVKETKEQ